jgi:HD-GYP domain-containing protein (c-di-GMP phosphodiesterase class II)
MNDDIRHGRRPATRTYAGREPTVLPQARIGIYVASAALAAVAVAAFTILSDPFTAGWQPLLGFALLTFLTAQFPLRLPGGSLYDISFLITFAAIIAAGPAVAMMANVFATFSVTDRRDRTAVKHVFNAAQLALSAAIPGLVYRALGGPIGSAWVQQDTVAALIPRALLALIVATLLHFAINTTLVSGAIALSTGRPFLNVWSGYPGLFGNYGAFAALGLLLGILQVRIGWPSVVFLILPLLVARHAFQAAVRMQRTYDDTVHALIKAIEAKDPYTSGHAERVSRLAEMTARAYGLREDRCRLIKYAAIMHDVGKLGVESSVLQKPGKLTPEEYEHMKVHPARGVEIVGEIDLMAEALGGIRHHHERLDGAGYPDGLLGDQIPLMARLIMVADAFDSMTSTRVYRQAKTMEEALAELHRCSGTQFDPAAIAALQRAIDRNGWEPQPEFDVPKEENADEHAVAR